MAKKMNVTHPSGLLIEELLQKQQQYLNYYFDNLRLEEIDTVIEACLKVEGLILFSGVGKSGIIA